VQNLGEDVCVATDLRPRIRRHPFLATGLAGVLGFFGGPLVLRGLRRVLEATSGHSGAGSPRSQGLPGIALASLRLVRGRI
jgi:hypothetical protein